MRYIEYILKGVAVLLGVFCVGYGILGLAGLNPGGIHQELWIRLAGAFMAFLGILYLCPNSSIAGHRRRKYMYYFVCCTPVLLVLGYGLFTIFHSGWNEFVSQGGVETTFGIMIGASIAPSSLYLYDKRYKMNEMETANRAP